LGRPEEAEQHYQEAIEIDPDYAEAHYNYANLLIKELGSPEEATGYFEKSVQLWISKGRVDNALNDLRTLVQVCRSFDYQDELVAHCELALEILGKIDERDTEDGLWFDSIRILAEQEDIDVPELYSYALQNVLASHPNIATDLFAGAWKRRREDESNAEHNDIILAAGVALAAHLRLIDRSDLSFSTDGILAEINIGELHEPEDVLYEQLSGESPSRNVDDLQSRATEHESQGDDFAALETMAFAVLLDQLR
jgi:tetratricopeptide (TPR) repeat protein